MFENKTSQSIFSSLLRLRDLIAVEARNPTVKFLDYCAKNLGRSKSQLFQDIFVAFCKREKRNGYFVEFGATNGVEFSNSYMLETHFGWNGVLAEPAKDWHFDLKKNRKASIDTRCVWSKTAEKLEFKETAYGEFSTILKFQDKDNNRDGRKGGKIYEVETVSLNDLLAYHKSPTHIDYLSIDTEGSELEILTAFDFHKYQIDIITVEHNFTDDRARIGTLLKGHGFVNVFEAFSSFDDWYLHQSFFDNLTV